MARSMNLKDTEFINSCDNLIKNKTVFVIAHKLSTIKNADRIAVINEGELAELGTHSELINISVGQYKFLYEMQFTKESLEKGALVEQ